MTFKTKSDYRHFFKTIRQREGEANWSDTILRDVQETLKGKGEVLGIYMPVGDEISPWPVAQALGFKTALPVTLPERGMAFRSAGLDDPMRKNTFDIPEPTQGGWVIPDILLIPLLACDGKGVRLGTGGGYYDRYLASYPHIIRIGIGYDAQFSKDKLPLEGHDMALHAFLCPSRLIEFSHEF